MIFRKKFFLLIKEQQIGKYFRMLYEKRKKRKGNKWTEKKMFHRISEITDEITVFLDILSCGFHLFIIQKVSFNLYEIACIKDP